MREYHQLITNAFRQVYSYNQAEPALDELIVIVQQVYLKYPIPLYPFWR